MSPNKSEIQSLLDKVRKLSKRLGKRVAELTEAQNDATAFAVTLEKNPSPDYKDEKAIQLVAMTKLKLQSCQDVIAKLEGEIDDGVTDAQSIAKSGAMICAAILVPACDAIRNTIYDAVRPFSFSDEHARVTATQMDAHRVACVKRERFLALGDRPLRNVAGVDEAFARIEAVLIEALKEKPAFQRFLDFDPEPQPAATETESTTATTEVNPAALVRARVLKKWEAAGCTAEQMSAFEDLLDDAPVSAEQFEKELNTLCDIYHEVCVKALRLDWAPFESIPGWEVHVSTRFPNG